MTERSPADILRVPPDATRKITDHLEAGGLLAYPTETVYGLGGAATPEVVERLRRLKGRSAHRSFLVLIGEMHADPLEWTPVARALADAFWPGPLTLVLRDPRAAFPPGVRDARGCVAVRISPHPFVRQLIGAWARPLLSTSANRAGGPPALSPDEVASALSGRPELHRLWLVDAGTLSPSAPSTLVDCSERVPAVLREGAVPGDRLRAVLQGTDIESPP